jgi:hypothetical protein
MPTYEWQCPKCEAVTVLIAPIAERAAPPQKVPCRCKRPYLRVILTPSMAQPDIRPYIAMAGDRAGKPITSRREHREFLKRNRLIEVGDAKPKDTSKMRKTVTRAEIREELKRVVPEVLRKQRRRA